jgi:hypothetical protein
LNGGATTGRLVVWHISDNRRGHDNQSLGLYQALRELRPCDYYKIDCCTGIFRLLLALRRRKFPPAGDLPDPDIIIGAGRRTHLTMLCARLIRGGYTVILMRPMLPPAWFDLLFIPAHDRPRKAPNIIATEGAINRAAPSDSHDFGKGLMLIGGPSRHYHWGTEWLLEQIHAVTGKMPGIHWWIADSPRTPHATSLALANLKINNIMYRPWQASQDAEWLLARLAETGTAWITEDSVSMIYEALTAGAAVGVLEVPAKRSSRVSRIPADLSARGMVTRYTDWIAGAPLRRPARINEAKRCAELLLQRSGL